MQLNTDLFHSQYLEEGMTVVKTRWYTWPVLLTIVVFIFFGCGCGLQSNAPVNPSPKPVEITSADFTLEIRQATWEAYAKVLKEVRESTFPIDPAMAKERLTEKESSYLIIDLRAPEHYARQHVRGAVNLTIVGLAENIGNLPKGKTLLLYCYTGQSSALAMVPLKAFGYQAIFVNGGFPLMEKAGFVMDSVETAFVPAKNELPTDPKAAAILRGIQANLLAIARQHTVKTLVVANAEVKELSEGSPDKYAFVDLRPREDYTKSHIKGAISAPLDELKTRVPDLPKEKKLVLCCKSGQLAAMATAPLTAEGFKIISLCAGLSQAEGWGFPIDKK